MTDKPTAAVILAAGLGTRMKSELPKVMHPLAGRPMIAHLLETVESLGLDKIVVVVGENMESLRDQVAPHKTVIQKDRLGTAHALLAARASLGDFDGDVLVLFGDSPLISPQTLDRMLAARNDGSDPAAVVLGFRPAVATGYGRLILGSDGLLTKIVEEKDASSDERAVPLCNSGAMAIDGRSLWSLVEEVGNDNAKGEYYLTDIVAMAHRKKRACSVVEGNEEELAGVNSRADLAAMESVVQGRLRLAAMEGGASLRDPETVYFNFDTKLGRDVIVGPNVVFGPGVVVEDGVEIKPFCHLEGAYVETGTTIGPFARLRPGTKVMKGARVGNFVEIKNAILEPGAKVSHLTYIGDAHIGAAANIGAGTITCNYDGFSKFHTEIGAGAFIGSNTALVAPVSVGRDAIVGAGSVITKDVADDTIAVTRAEQKNLAGKAKRLRERQEKRK
jgi:bifunctional UDP-N-acetylglucosamine pyrophosphorylase / glucosamine-1-phosphate N-acetyltransferase